ncbi:MAG: hypothetical protein ACKESB_02660 [Candidatus Hodgkinia cicadicola]
MWKRVCGMLVYVKFLLSITGYQLSKFVRIRPDWISRQVLRWGLPQQPLYVFIETE